MKSKFDAGTSTGKLYEVEKILKKRVDRRTKKPMYLLKWIGYGKEHNSWEPKENIVCPPNLLANFERKWEEAQRKRKNGKRRAHTPVLREAEGTKVVAEEVTGFNRGLEPEKILGATNDFGELVFLMKWKGTFENDLVPASEANVKCPQIVIQFYENRLVWYLEGEKRKL